MTKSEAESNEPFLETTKSKLRRIQKHKRTLLSLSQLRKISQNKCLRKKVVVAPQNLLSKPSAENLPKEEPQQSNNQFSTKINIQKLFLEKLHKPQGNHLLHKLVSHVSERWSKEKTSTFDTTQITAKMIKESLHGETVNFGRKNNFTLEEDAFILNLIAKIGKNWKEIAAALRNKTPNMIKNRYYTYLKKKFDQKYSEILSMRSVPSTEASVKIEEEPNLLKALEENRVKKAELDYELKIKTLNELLRVNQILDQEKSKIVMNILKLSKSIASDKESRNRLAGVFKKDVPVEFVKNFLGKNESMTPGNLGCQINNLEIVIREALKQLNSLKKAHNGV